MILKKCICSECGTELRAKIEPLTGDRGFDQMYSVHYYCPGNERHWAHTRFRLEVSTPFSVSVNEWTLKQLNLSKAQTGYDIIDNHGFVAKKVG